MRTRREDTVKDVAEHGVRPRVESAAAPSPQRTEARIEGDGATPPPQEKRPGFLLVLLRALSAWNT